MESTVKIGNSVENSAGKIDRRISVAPMMDWSDEVRSILQIKWLGAAKLACLLYVSSKICPKCRTDRHWPQDGQIKVVPYQETEHLQLTRRFLEAPERFYRFLLTDDDAASESSGSSAGS
jgi:hypothetical protein